MYTIVSAVYWPLSHVASIVVQALTVSSCPLPAPLGRHAIFSIAQMQNLGLNCSGIKSSTVEVYIWNIFVCGGDAETLLPAKIVEIYSF